MENLLTSPNPGPGVYDGKVPPADPQVPLLHLPSPVIEHILSVQLSSKGVSASLQLLPFHTVEVLVGLGQLVARLVQLLHGLNVRSLREKRKCHI